MSTFVYVVTASRDYEGSDNVCAFSNEGDAQAFVNKCVEHEAKKPMFPEIDDDNKTWDRKHKTFTRWQKRHPAGEDNAQCSYEFHKLTLDATP